jgi:hypothetical protein
MTQEVVRQLIGALMNLAIRERALHSPRPFGFNYTLPVRKALGIGSEYLMDG